MILTNPGFEGLIEPVRIDNIRIEIFGTFRIIAGRNIHSAVCVSHCDVLGILVGIHYIIYILFHLVETNVTAVVHLHCFVMLPLLCCDDNHAVCCTRTVDCGSRGILEYLK